jgi:hypothetical protein
MIDLFTGESFAPQDGELSLRMEPFGYYWLA